MMRTITGLLLLVCLMSAFAFGASDSKKAQAPSPAHPDTSAPDSWGYTWVKSTDAGGPQFKWIDISTTGTAVAGLTDDNVVGPFDLRWNFPYYWYTANRFKVGSNGYITFDNSTTAFSPPFAACPTAAAPNDMMAVCVGDLVFSGQAGAAGQCYYWSNGNDSLVVSFINVTEWESVINANTKHTFQVILNKNDSSITYQYGLQQGRYNSTNNTRLCIGMENATGTIGLNYAFSTAPPHALMPDSGLAIKFKRTVNTGLQITDAGVVGGLNASNIGKVWKFGVTDTVQAVVKNFGTANLTNVRVTYAISKTAQTTVFDTVFVAALAAGATTTVSFPRLFTPAVTGSYSALFSVFVPNDALASNNTKTAEIAVASFALGQSTTLQFESGTAGGSINWIGGGGMGVMFDTPVYPVRIETVYVNVAAVTTQPMTVEILDGSSGVPGSVLATRSVTAVVGMNAVVFTSDSVRISSGRWFVGARGQMAFSYETTAPIAYRSWEYTGGWAPYRSGDLQDVIIRATVRQVAPVSYSWATQTSGTALALRTVKTVSSTVAWIGGASGTVLRTTDGGATWTSVGGGPMTGNTIYSIDALSATTAFVTTSPAAGSYIFRTTNGGTSWDTVYTQGVGGFIDAIKMFDANNGMAVGDPVDGKWTILKTSNGGSSWARIATEPVQAGTESGYNTSFASVGSTNIWFGTNNSRVYRSTNGGATWSFASTSFTASTGVGFADAQYGIAGGSGTTGAARSIDGGGTWTTVTLPSTGSIYGVAGKGPNFWAVRGTVVVKSTNQGATWDTSYAGAIGAFRHLDFLWSGTQGYGWAVTSTGGIAKYGPVTTGVNDDIVGGVPQEFSLMQNYPNPFNPSTNIHYGLPRAAHVSVRIYNLLGQEVAQLKDEIENAGTHEVVWLGRNTAGTSVASGVYFYQLEARPVDGTSPFNSFKKMLLLK